MGILSTATIRKHWMKGCDLPSQNEMKKMGWGTHRCKCYLNSGLVIAWWYDNKCVNICSIYANPEPFSPVIRWDWVNKKHINIYSPDAIKECSKSMGGVDLADMLISLYRTTVKTKRLYLKILFLCVDISKVNAWMLYHRHCNQLQVLQKKQISLLTFIIKITEDLGSANKVPRGIGRPSKRKSRKWSFISVKLKHSWFFVIIVH